MNIKNPAGRLLTKWIILLMYMSLVSCSTEDKPIEIPGSDIEDVEVIFNLITTSNPTSYSMSTGNESEIQEIGVLVFTKLGNGYVFERYCEGEMTSTSNFVVTLKKDLENVYSFVVLANSKEFLTAADGFGKYAMKDQLLPYVESFIEGKWNSTSSTDFAPIPMWGESGDIYGIDENTNLNSIVMLRSLARVDIVSTVAESLFRLEEVYVYNWKKRGRVIPIISSDYWNEADFRATKPTLPEDTTGLNVQTPLTYTNPSTDGFVRDIYLHEAIAVSDGEYLEATCLVIGGKYDGASDNSYYRVDFRTEFGGTVNYANIVRNHLYVMKITGVKQEGYQTPEEAFRAVRADMIIDITTWNMFELSNTDIDGSYNFNVNQSSFEFNNLIKSDILKITTDHPKGWALDGITGSFFTLAPDYVNNTITITIVGTPATGSEGYFFITVGNMEKKISVSYK